ncbi:hypothetical protein LO772_31905 [Yinghuangia sp. ASG 101]|uniref:hypothetical protein n=1 Tax=Yinghuangia sp. ASG 101 TaxID=2896848 RepID=UPI001E3A68E5|nr:hypothetical protein [Yinghuangia sp. ASG 101]UGQ11350.1 hypothetical protein LO772_31905 [Yinghuangia sp. ASG 101]
MNDVLAVIAQDNCRLHFVDAADHRELARVDLPPEPHEVPFDADHREETPGRPPQALVEVRAVLVHRV